MGRNVAKSGVECKKKRQRNLLVVSLPLAAVLLACLSIGIQSIAFHLGYGLYKVSGVFLLRIGIYIVGIAHLHHLAEVVGVDGDSLSLLLRLLHPGVDVRCRRRIRDRRSGRNRPVRLRLSAPVLVFFLCRCAFPPVRIALAALNPEPDPAADYQQQQSGYFS